MKLGVAEVGTPVLGLEFGLFCEGIRFRILAIATINSDLIILLGVQRKIVGDGYRAIANDHYMHI